MKYISNVKNFFIALALIFGSILFLGFILEIALRMCTKLATVKSLQLSIPKNNQIPAKEYASADSASSLFMETPTGLRFRPNSHIQIKNHFLSHQDVDLEINSLGFRYPLLVKKKQDEIRTLVLGDSITAADYLPYQYTYPALLESYFEQKKIEGWEGKQLRFINAGVGTIDTNTELFILKENGLAAEPDVVLVGMYLNDATCTFYINMKEIPQWVQQSYLLSYIYKFIRLMEVVWFKIPDRARQKSIVQAKNKFVKAHGIDPSEAVTHVIDFPTTSEGFDYHIYDRLWDWGYAWTDEAWDEMGTIMAEMKRVCDSHHIRLAVILFPVVYQVQSPVDRHEPQQKFKQLMTQLGIDHLDLLPILREKFKKDKQNMFYDHCHLTPEGYIYITYFLAGFMENQVFKGLRP